MEENKTAVLLVVRDTAQESEQSLGHTGRDGPPRGEGVSSPRSVDLFLRKLLVLGTSRGEVTVLWK